MTEARKQLGMTAKQQGVVAMIIEILKDMPSNRIRGIHAHMDAKKEGRPCHSLVTATIKALTDAGILELIEFKKVPGEKMRSALYEWHEDIYQEHEIVTIKQKKPRRRAKKQTTVIEPPQVVEEAPEDYYMALCQEIVSLEREQEERGRVLAIKREEKAAVDESIANARRFFAQREGK